jgi:hypothetical protein
VEWVMSFKALMSHTILTYPKITYPYKELKAKMKEQALDEPLSITSYSLATLLRLAEQGLGNRRCADLNGAKGNYRWSLGNFKYPDPAKDLSFHLDLYARK